MIQNIIKMIEKTTDNIKVVVDKISKLVRRKKYISIIMVGLGSSVIFISGCYVDNENSMKESIEVNASVSEKESHNEQYENQEIITKYDKTTSEEIISTQEDVEKNSDVEETETTTKETETTTKETETTTKETETTTKETETTTKETETTTKETETTTKETETTTKEIETGNITIEKKDFQWTSNSSGSKKIIKLKYMNQNDYPTGCESVTTCMALNYMGYEMSVDNFIDNYLDKYSISWGENVMYGEDPDEYFIGNPRSSHSYGCYAPVIKKALINIAGNDSVHDLTGMDIEVLIEKYVSKGIPVILWATIGMSKSYAGNSWYIQRTDEMYTWIAGEHCLLLAGWDNDNYYFYDPYKNRGVKAYKKEVVEKRYKELGKQALAIVKENE